MTKTDFNKAIKDLLGKETIDKIKALKTKFFPISLKQAKLQDGTIIEYNGDTPQQGMEIYAVTEAGNVPLADGDFVMEDGTKLVIKGGKIVTVEGTNNPAQQPAMTTENPAGVQQPGKPQPSKVTKIVESVFRKKQPETAFFTYLKTDYLDEAKFAGADYPWDQCMNDQTTNGVDCPDCVCAAIKNRTVAHLINSKQAKDVYEAVAIIEERFSSDPVYSYLYKQAISKDVNAENIKSLTSKLEQANAQMETMRAQIKEMGDINKEMFGIIEKIAESPAEVSRHKPKDKVVETKEKSEFERNLEIWKKSLFEKKATI